MLYKVSNLLVNMLVGKNSLKTEKQEVYMYGTMLFVSTFVGLLSLFFVSIIFFDLVTFLVFLSFFVPLRLYAGGYHCKNYSTCFVVSNILFVLVVLSAKVIYSISWITTVFSSITFIMVILFSPVTNNANPLSERRKQINRKKSIYIVTAQFAIINIPIFLQLKSIGYYIGLATCSELSIAILMMIEIIIERRRKNA